ncbi:MAG TPA: hypothetical protein PLD88_00150, partial [Candidatus Berkiella sp.]|nr:hypothetical protein [Candidatus Berkiella sp.]
GNISNFKGRVRESEEKIKQIEMQIAAPERAKQIAIAKIRDEIAGLKNEQGYTDPDTKAENQRQIAKLEKRINLEESKPSHTEDTLAEYEKSLKKVEQVFSNNQEKAKKANEIIAHFSVPTS